MKLRIAFRNIKIKIYKFFGKSVLINAGSVACISKEDFAKHVDAQLARHDLSDRERMYFSEMKEFGRVRITDSTGKLTSYGELLAAHGRISRNASIKNL